MKKVLIGVTALLVISLISIFVGNYKISLFELDSLSLNIIIYRRIPRILMAIIAGFGIAYSGLVLQIVFKNPLASPDLIGVASFANVGAAFALMFFSSLFVTFFLSFVFGLFALFLIIVISKIVGTKGNNVILIGIILNSFASALLMLLKYVATDDSILASIEFWLMGSLANSTYPKLIICFFVTLIAVLFIQKNFKKIIILSLSYDEASYLGLNVVRFQKYLLFFTSLTVSAIVSTTGILAYIGLLGPHIGKRIIQMNQKLVLVMSGIVSSIILLVSDMFSRSLVNTEIPISIITSFIGTLFLLYYLTKRGVKNGY